MMQTHKKCSPVLVALIVAVPIIVLQIFAYLHAEQPIYVWDYKGYWKVWEYYAQLLFTSPLEWLHNLRHSVKYDDYNPLPVALLFPFYYLPLSSRASYLLATSFAYLIPLIILIQAILKRVQKNTTCLWILCITIFAATYAPFWTPIFKGYPDTIGLLPILGVVLFVITTDLKDKLSIKNFLILGVLLWLPFVLRRWYAYSVVALYLSLPFLSFFTHTLNQKKNFKQFFFICLHFFFAGLLSLLLVYLFQKELVLRVLTTDYSVLYSAYQYGWYHSVTQVTIAIGWFMLPVIALGSLYSFIGKRNHAKNFGLFCLANLIISFTLFSSTQSPGIQHIMPFALWLFFISAIGFYWLLELLHTSSIQKGFMILCMCISMVICAVTFHKFNDHPVLLNSWLPRKFYPLEIENYANYQKLASDIEQWIASGSSITVIASSDKLNDALIETLTQDRIKPYMPPQSHVDLRDGLVLERFWARYVIVGDPVQTHLPSGQNVVTIPAHEFLSGTGISAAYRRLPIEYELASGIKAIAFERTRPLTHQELKDFISLFVNIYPEWEATYLNPLALAYIGANITLGDGQWSHFRYDLSGAIIAHPSETKPVRVEWDFGDMQQITIASTNGGCGDYADGVIIWLENDAGQQERIDVPNMATVTADVSAFAHQRGRIIIDMNQNPACDGIEIRAQ